MMPWMMKESRKKAVELINQISIGHLELDEIADGIESVITAAIDKRDEADKVERDHADNRRLPIYANCLLFPQNFMEPATEKNAGVKFREEYHHSIDEKRKNPERQAD